jgi:CRP-like cAMP-binding protein
MSFIVKNEISKIALFSGIDQEQLSTALKECTLQEFQPEQYIYRYGEYGDDCGIILSGSAQVDLSKQRAEETDKKIILQSGEIFGEIAALSGYTRTADVRALKQTKVFVISRETLLKLLDRFPSFKKKIDSLYRERVLSTQLLTVPIFAGVPIELLEQLAKRAVLVHFRKGEAVFRQGDEADTFYLVRYGFLKVSEKSAEGQERVLAYLKGGHYFGEIALIRKDEKRLATVTAIDPTELIGISREDFLKIINSNPRVKAGLENAVEKTQEKIAKIRADESMARTLSAVIDSGVIQATGILVIDTTKCIQCDNCVKACAALHKNQSLLVRKGTKLNNILLFPTSCRNCNDPVCMIKCPTGTIARDCSGEIYHKDTCIGCGNCSRNCPYGNISIITLPEKDKKKNLGQRYLRGNYKNKQKSTEQTLYKKTDKKRKKPSKKAVKCDMCRDYPFLGCVYNCPKGAARRIYPSEFFTDISMAT